MPQQSLPAGIKVIFVDWHGVVSRDPFWISILHNPWHPLHQQLSNATERLFAQQTEIVHAWMRGELTAHQIIESFQITPCPGFPLDYLQRKLIEDCQFMRVDGSLIQYFKAVQKAGIKIVLATDNMDCFLEAIQRARQQKPISTQQTPSEKSTFIAVAQQFDDILCSSEQRVLKREDPQRFFADWLNRHAFDFCDTLLLDDLEVNCNAFRAVAGHAQQVILESWRTDIVSIVTDLSNRPLTRIFE